MYGSQQCSQRSLAGAVGRWGVRAVREEGREVGGRVSSRRCERRYPWGGERRQPMHR